MAGYFVRLLGSASMIGLIFLMIVMVGGAAEGRTLIVDDDGGEDYICIQDAIDEAKDGDEIRVYAGTYRETLSIDRSVHLKGNGTSTTFIEGTASKETITIDAKIASVEGFTIEGGSSGVLVKSGNAIIKANRMRDTIYGVIVIGSRSLITGNTIVKSSYAGILVTHASKTRVEENTIFGSQQGIIVENSQNVSLRYNELRDNVFSFGSSSVEEILSTSLDGTNTVDGKPIFFMKNASGEYDGRDHGQYIIVNCTDLTLNDPEIRGGIIGVMVLNSTTIGIMNANITECETGIRVLDSDTVRIRDAICSFGGTGIEIRETVGSEISGGRFENNSLDGLRLVQCTNPTMNGVISIMNEAKGAMLTDCTGSTILNSEFERNGDGIYLMDNDIARIIDCKIRLNTNNGIYLQTGRNVVISGCEIAMNNVGILVQSGEWYDIKGNNIESNDEIGVLNGGVSRWEIDITGNWWGTVDGPYHKEENPEGSGNPISGNLDPSPWRASPVVLMNDDQKHDNDEGMFDPVLMILLIILGLLIFMIGGITLQVFRVNDVWEEQDLRQ